MRTGPVLHHPRAVPSERGPQLKTFLRHVFEMIVAMMLGMVVLGMTFRAIHLAVFGTAFDDAWHEHTELAVFAMTFNMTLPMVAWMRHRGHAWERCGEMAAGDVWRGVCAARAVLAGGALGRRPAAPGDGADAAGHGRRDGGPI
jgi:hypothetical protein